MYCRTKKKVSAAKKELAIIRKRISQPEPSESGSDWETASNFSTWTKSSLSSVQQSETTVRTPNWEKRIRDLSPQNTLPFERALRFKQGFRPKALKKGGITVVLGRAGLEAIRMIFTLMQVATDFVNLKLARHDDLTKSEHGVLRNLLPKGLSDFAVLDPSFAKVQYELRVVTARMAKSI